MSDASASVPFCPYKGPESFTFVDRPLFFGRRSEDRLLAARIALQPLSIMTGPAGCGKSSLLRTGVVPTLLAGGWACVYVHPGDNPCHEIARGIRVQTQPNAATEAAVLDVLRRTYGSVSNGGDPRLSMARRWFAELPVDAPARLQLLVPDGGDPRSVRALPFLAQALSGLIDDDALTRRLTGAPPPGRARDRAGLTLDAASKLIEGLPATADGTAEAGADMFSETEQFFDSVAARRGYRGLVIVLDQAEELYTRFGLTAATTAAEELQPWTTRAEFFADLRKLRELLKPPREAPLRVCISLRREWFAEMRVSLGDLAPGEDAVHHMALFTRGQAEEALLEPAKALQVTWEEKDAAPGVLDGLTGEDDRIDPFLLAITTTLVWKHAVDAKHERTITWSHVLEALGMPQSDKRHGILLEAAVTRALDVALMGHTLAQQFDMLELIRSLATPAGTRLFLPSSQLIHQPLRRPQQLQAALTALQDAKLVRVETRGTGDVDDPDVEIRHDRLLEPARRRLHDLRQRETAAPARNTVLERRNRAQLPLALNLLRSLPVTPLDLVDRDTALWDRLPAFVRDCVDDNADLLQLDEPAALMRLSGLLGRPLRDRRPDLKPKDAEEALRERAAWRTAVLETIDDVTRPRLPGERTAAVSPDQASILANASEPDGEQLLALIETTLCQDAPDAPQEVAVWISRWRASR